MSTFQGAGGTSGGIAKFLIGILLFIGGMYLLLSSIQVYNDFSFGYNIFSFGRFGITSGFIMIPFIFGVGMIFFNYKNIFGWLLAGGSIAALIFGVIASTHFALANMSAFDLIVILVMVAGGLGLFFSSLKEQ